MDEDLIARLGSIGEELHTRALALAHPDQNHDLALIMSGLALTIEAVRSLGLAASHLDGLSGLGSTGD
ncbi:hypothetical protein QO002_002172 [Pararhizobium capsulatum DSM 1112]|uniref:Uncharacterized protein n=1 Tax=Pararhizobium capsulatum DSM 1112 TaxID=1121113 RepID=A0ABU0BQL4_9HYPH|nr:hypothetical protein [Pararhizobium capsulatum]MDQ0320034.1 hypothetical protein [Pararhizobium capsulatum DSM 1112]